MNESQAFQPLRTSVVSPNLFTGAEYLLAFYSASKTYHRSSHCNLQPGEREFEADVSRRTTEDSVYSQATARTHVSSPHAAAASRRFLASSTTSFRGIGALACKLHCMDTFLLAPHVSGMRPSHRLNGFVNCCCRRYPRNPRRSCCPHIPWPLCNC